MYCHREYICIKIFSSIRAVEVVEKSITKFDQDRQINRKTDKKAS